MIVKPFVERSEPKNRAAAAGYRAERQLAFYLHRDFAESPSVYVLHDLRLEDSSRTEANGSAQSAQIDCLVVHRYGAFIVEVKSRTDPVEVRYTQEGGEEWVVKGKKTRGMQTPAEQARYQAVVLRNLLQDHREELLGKMHRGLRTLTKVVKGTDQRGFASMPLQVVTAVSDETALERRGRRTKVRPFQSMVCKSAEVGERIREEIGRHIEAGKTIGAEDGEYGVWRMKEEEVRGVAAFLRGRHTPKPPPWRGRATPKETATLREDAPVGSPAPRRGPGEAESTGRSGEPAPAAVCKHCGGRRLVASSGRYGPYWRCLSCDRNTSMPRVCPKCRKDGRQDKSVRVRKLGEAFVRFCDACGEQDVVWETRLNAAAPEPR